MPPLNKIFNLKSTTTPLTPLRNNLSTFQSRMAEVEKGSRAYFTGQKPQDKPMAFKVGEGLTPQQTDAAESVLQKRAVTNKPMVFRVGEGLTPKQTVRAKATIGKSQGGGAVQPKAPTLSDITKEVPQAVKETPKRVYTFAKDIFQDINRNIASGVLSMSKPQADDVQRSVSADEIDSYFGKQLFTNVFGVDQTIKPAEQRVVEAEPKTESFQRDLNKLLELPNLNKRERFIVKRLASLDPKILAFLGVMGTIGLDVTPFGGTKKGVFTAFKQVDNVLDATKVLKQLGVADDLAKQYADEVVNVKNTKQAKELFERIVKTQEAVPTPGTTAPLAGKVDDVAKQTQGGVDDIATQVSKAKAEGKSFDEFVEAQNKLIHITKPENVSSIEVSGLKYTPKTEGSISEGISLAGKRTETNEIFGKSSVDIFVDPKAKTITMTKALDNLGFPKNRTVRTDGIKKAESNAIQWAKDNGYDVLDMRDAKSSVYAGMDEIRVFNPNAIKTKSQLKEAWDKVDDITTQVSKAKAEGKSFDEFVEGQGARLYRGQPEAFKDVQKVAQSNAVDNILIGRGVFTTTDIDLAKSYGTNIFEFQKPKGKIFDLSNANEADLRKIMPPSFFEERRLGGLIERPDDIITSSYKTYKRALKDGNIKDAEDLLFENYSEKYLPDDISWEAVKSGTTAVSGRGPLVDEVRDNLVKDLTNADFEWIKHKGGIRAGNKEHDVFIALKDEALKSPVKTRSQLKEAWDKVDDLAPKPKPLKLSQEGIPLALTKREQSIVDLANSQKKTGLPPQPAPTTKVSLIGKLKQQLNPVKNLKPEDRLIFENWNKSTIKAKTGANAEIGKIGVPEKDGAKIILDYQAGRPTRYSSAIRKRFDDLLQEARDAGFDVPRKENYLPQVYKETPEQVSEKIAKYLKSSGMSPDEVASYTNGVPLSTEKASRLGLNPSFTQESVFPNYATAMEFGLTPRYSNPDQLAAFYKEQLGKNIANRKLVEDLLTQRRIVPVNSARDGFVPINLEFSKSGYYAEPQVANLINGLFKGHPNVFDSIVGGFATGSRRAQELVLSAGVPKTNVNFFAIGQLIKELTRGNVKSLNAFFRSNFNEKSLKWLQGKSDVIDRMANQNIDMSRTIAEWDYVYKNEFSGVEYRKILGNGFDKFFNEKTFRSFMPQMQIQAFDDVYKQALKKGMSGEAAEKLAGDTIKNNFGLSGFTGRSRRVEDFMSAFFFAPKFRESIINTLYKTGEGGVDFLKHLGGLRGKLDPALSNNRKLLSGMIISYGMYNALNYKLNGHYMWDNPDNRQFALRIPTGNQRGDTIYIEFMPSFLAFARNMVQGGIGLAEGDLKTSTQKFGSVFSIPMKLTSEVKSNRDYFGNEIYKDTDSKSTKAEKIAKYLGLHLNHPYVAEVIKYLTAEEGKEKPLYQHLTVGMELPLKYGTEDKEEANRIFDVMDQQNQYRADLKTKAEKKYAELSKMSPEERAAEAKRIYDEEPDLYSKLKDIGKKKDSNLTDNERYIKMLGPEYRAKYIYEAMKKLQTKQKKEAYVQNLINKKVITKDTFKYLADLLQQSNAK